MVGECAGVYVMYELEITCYLASLVCKDEYGGMWLDSD